MHAEFYTTLNLVCMCIPQLKYGGHKRTCKRLVPTDACMRKQDHLGRLDLSKSINCIIKMIHRCIEGPLGFQRFWGHDKTMKLSDIYIYMLMIRLLKTMWHRHPKISKQASAAFPKPCMGPSFDTIPAAFGELLPHSPHRH